MEYARLGRTGLKVSRLCLGTMNFGPLTSEADSRAIMDRAVDQGVNFLDTANVYGWRKGEGVTEQIVGRWLAQGGGRREKIVLATKVYGRMGDGPNERGLSAYHIRRACEESLRRLQTDRIDLYQMHHVDRDAPWDEIWQAMEQLIGEGKVIYVGSSNFAGWHIAQAQSAAAARHFLGLVSEQSLYNLKDRMVELEVIPACRAYGIGLIPWSPLAAGLLAGRPRQGRAGTAARGEPGPEGNASAPGGSPAADLRAWVLDALLTRLDPSVDIRTAEGRKVVEDLLNSALTEKGVVVTNAGGKRLFEQALADLMQARGRRTSEQARQKFEQYRPQLERYEALCDEIGAEPADVALAWLLHNPAVTAPIIGPRTMDQLEDSLRAVDLKLSEEALKKLDDIWPGPGGEAPEAYAW